MGGSKFQKDYITCRMVFKTLAHFDFCWGGERGGGGREGGRGAEVGRSKICYLHAKCTCPIFQVYNKQIKYTPAARSKISPKLIFASSDHAYYWMCVFTKDIGRRFP